MRNNETGRGVLQAESFFLSFPLFASKGMLRRSLNLSRALIIRPVCECVCQQADGAVAFTEASM